MIDIDDVEYCRWCSEPLALIELAQDVGQGHKCAKVTANLADLATRPAYRCFYAISQGDIVQFRVAPLTMNGDREYTMSPAEYARFLLGFHERHDCPKRHKATGEDAT